MEAIILCGGKGTRLGNLTEDIPKPMLPINGKPFLEYQVEKLLMSGVKKIIFSCGYKWEKIHSYFGNHDYFVYVTEDKPLGTAGAVRNCLDHIEGPNVLIVNGDTFCDMELRLFIQKNFNEQIAISLSRVQEPNDYGAVLIGRNDLVLAFLEKPKAPRIGNYVSNGIYLINKNIIKMITKDKEISLETNIFPRFTRSNWVQGYCTDSKFIDIGTPERYMIAQEWVKNNL